MREQTVTVYLADDGTEFRIASACEQYERDCAAVDAVLAPLGTRRPDGNGANFVQHEGITGDALWRAIQALPGAPHPRDCGYPWNRAYYRAQCVDNRGREWGQPYFANNPNADAIALFPEVRDDA